MLLKYAMTLLLGGGGQMAEQAEMRGRQSQVKTGIWLCAVPYALRVINVYIMDVALKNK